MKLIIENWREFVNEQTTTPGLAELYPKEEEKIILEAVVDLFEQISSVRIKNWFLDGMPRKNIIKGNSFTNEGARYWDNLRSGDKRQQLSREALLSIYKYKLRPYMDDFSKDTLKDIASSIEAEFEFIDKLFSKWFKKNQGGRFTFGISLPKKCADRGVTTPLVKFEGTSGVVVKGRGRNWGIPAAIEYLKSLEGVGGVTWFIEDMSYQQGGQIYKPEKQALHGKDELEHSSHQCGYDIDISLPATKEWSEKTAEVYRRKGKATGAALVRTKLLSTKQKKMLDRLMKKYEEYEKCISSQEINQKCSKVLMRGKKYRFSIEKLKRKMSAIKPRINKLKYTRKKHELVACAEWEGSECKEYYWRFASLVTTDPKGNLTVKGLDTDAAAALVLHAFAGGSGWKVTKIFINIELIKAIIQKIGQIYDDDPQSLGAAASMIRSKILGSKDKNGNWIGRYGAGQVLQDPGGHLNHFHIRLDPRTGPGKPEKTPLVAKTPQ
jgi:hypothetical protein